jgi:hypothetical protein
MVMDAAHGFHKLFGFSHYGPIWKMPVISSQQNMWISVFDSVLVLLSDLVLVDYQ